MWFDKAQNSSWTALWHNYVCCGDCPGIRTLEGPCPACGAPAFDLSPKTLEINGEIRTVAPIFAGAEGRYEDYIYLQMLQREWERPAAEFEPLLSYTDAQRPSARAALVLLFWGYFETRIERLHRSAMRHLPERVLEDTLRRYSGIGPRLYDLYKIFFSTTYFEDLRALGHGAVADLLKDLHERRNQFAHGKPQAINDATVIGLVEHLKDEHEGWIAVYNRRVAPAARQ